MEHATPSIDRPPPGHYQGRLASVVGALPAADARPWSGWQRAPAPRRLVIRARRGRSRQLALPLEAVRG